MKTKHQIILIVSSLVVFSNCNGQSNKMESTYKIEEIVQMEDPTESIMELDTKLNEKSDYGNKMEALSDAEKVVVFIENLEREVNNGGFNQFFWNTGGDFAHETLDALKRIGANKTAEIVSRAYAEWPDSKIPNEQLERRNVLEKIEDKAQEAWSICDAQFYEYEDDLTSLLLTFVKANKNEFN